MADYTKMSAGEMMLEVGLDADRWADAFLQIHPDCNLDKETMRAWFANTIMAGKDSGNPINGDHLQCIVDNIKKQEK